MKKTPDSGHTGAGGFSPYNAQKHLTFSLYMCYYNYRTPLYSNKAVKQ